MDDGDDHIDGEKFQLIMKDADVLGTLRTCGTDIDGLLMLSEVLFPHSTSEISFTEFFSVIVRLRKGKPVSISEIIGLQEFTKQKMDRLEEVIREGHGLKSRRSSKSGSVLDADRVRRKITRLEREVSPEERTSHKWGSGVSDKPEETPPPVRHPPREAERIRQNWIRGVTSDDLGALGRNRSF